MSLGWDAECPHCGFWGEDEGYFECPKCGSEDIIVEIDPNSYDEDEDY